MAGGVARGIAEDKRKRVRERSRERLGDESVGCHGLDTSGIIRGLYIGKHLQE